MVGKHGEWYYNFWKDRDNPRGLWRRTSWDSYRAGTPEWDVLLDVDALAAAEGQDWVFHGANFLRPAPGEPHRRALLAFSPDGGDANRHREFDVEARGFVDPADGGFDLPTGKGNASWLDGDTLLVATTADDLPRTTSSYARTGVKLRRGESLAAGRAAVRHSRGPHDGDRGPRLHTGLRTHVCRRLDQLLREEHLGAARWCSGCRSTCRRT